MLTPDEAAAISLSRTARKARPGAPRSSSQASTNSDERERPGQVVDGAVERERLPEDGHVVEALAEQVLAPEELDRLAAVRHRAQLVPRDQVGHRDRQPERDEREVEPREAERRDPEQEAEHARDERRDRDRPEVADAVRDEERRRVAAYRHEGALGERDLARVAGDDVEPDDRDEVRAHLRALDVADLVPVRGEHDERDARGEGEHGRDRPRDGEPRHGAPPAARRGRSAARAARSGSGRARSGAACGRGRDAGACRRWRSG